MEKDYQQQARDSPHGSDLNLPVQIRTVATVREPDGLALSSRNRYLDPAERRAAAVFSRALAARGSRSGRGWHDAGRVRHIFRETVQSRKAAALEYAEVADAETLEPLTRLAPGHRAVALLAVRVGSARLIDNQS